MRELGGKWQETSWKFYVEWIITEYLSIGRETFAKDHIMTLLNGDEKIILRDNMSHLFRVLKHSPLICS